LNEIAIKVENLGKRYHIGETVGYNTLRESVTNAFIKPFRRRRSPEDQPAIASEKPSHIWALRNVSFEVERGQVVGIIGKNGSGKSTLLKILSRIISPTEGYAEIRGNVTSLLEVGTGFHPELTGRENIMLSSAILGMKSADIKRKFGEIIDFAGDMVKEFIDTPVKRYSSGMYMRLAFAVAANLETEIMLIDEVLAVGDTEFQNKCLDKMSKVAQSGRTVIFVSHNLNAISQLCQRAILFDSGSIAMDGHINEVLTDYLKTQKMPMGEVMLEPPTPLKNARVTRAYVTQNNDTPTPLVSYSNPFSITLEYEVLQPVNNLRVGFRLHNYQDVAILQTATSDAGVSDMDTGSPGIHRAKVQIPGAWLAPGNYYLELGAWSPGVGHHHYVLKAMGFEISGSELENSGSEILRPTLVWELA
jgi:lipopolysaccharide transport system ATP-binding protein